MRKVVFISYSHTDKPWLERLQGHLSPALPDREISVWTDTEIEPGKLFDKEINKAIDSARVAVLLVSAAFLDSDFITIHELPRVVKAWKKERIVLIWIAVGKTLYRHTALKGIQAANDPTKPLDTLSQDDCEKALEKISKKIIAAAGTEDRHRRKSYYFNYIPFAVITLINILLFGNYLTALIVLTTRQSQTLFILLSVSVFWIVVLGVYAYKAFKHNQPIPAPNPFWRTLFGKLATVVGGTERLLSRPRILIVADEGTKDIAQQIENEYSGTYLETDQFICPHDFESIDLAEQLREVQALYLFRTRETKNNRQLWPILKKWELEEAHKPIIVVDFLDDDYRLPYTRIPKAQALQGVWKLLAHGTERANVWRMQAKTYRRVSLVSILVLILFAGVFVYTLSKYQNYKLLQNIHNGIARQTRKDLHEKIKTQLNQATFEDKTLNVSYWFAYKNKLYQLGTAVEDPQRSLSQFEIDRESVIGCAYTYPNHSVQWDYKSGQNFDTSIADWSAKPDVLAGGCKFRELVDKPFNSIVCATYDDPDNVSTKTTVGICVFTNSKDYVLSNALPINLYTWLRERAREFHEGVSSLLRDEKLVPPERRPHAEPQ